MTRSPGRNLGRLLAQLLLLGLGAAASGCGEKGGVTFVFDTPGDARLNVFADPRRDFVSFVDITNRRQPMPLGRVVGTNEKKTGETTPPVADVPVGTYDVLAQVLGGGQLIGQARTLGVQVLPLQATTATFAVRKPIAFYMSAKVVNPGALSPGLYAPWPFPPLQALDVTLAPLDPTLSMSQQTALIPPLARFNLPGCGDAVRGKPPMDPTYTPPNCSTGGATATTADGKYVVLAFSSGTRTDVLVLSTARLFEADSNDRNVASAFITKVPSQQAYPLPRRIAITREAPVTVAIATDQGLSLVELGDQRLGTGLLGGAVDEIPTIPIVDADNKLLPISSLAFAPDGESITALTGPTWRELNCGVTQPTATHRVLLDGTVESGQSAPDNATDVAYAPDGRLLFGAPCGAGVVQRNNVPDIPGHLVGHVLVTADRVFAVDGKITTIATTDPGNPQRFSADLISYGADPGERATASFQVPIERVPTPSLIGTKSLFVPVPPKELLVHEMAASPDASHVVMASRTRYEELNTELLTVKDANNKKIGWCTLELTRNVYRVSVVDTAKGGDPLFERMTGVDETTKCLWTCSSVTTVGGKDTVTTATDKNACSTVDGFIPSGLSLTFGSF